MSEYFVNLFESNLLNENRTQHAKEPLVNTADQKSKSDTARMVKSYEKQS